MIDSRHSVRASLSPLAMDASDLCTAFFLLSNEQDSQHAAEAVAAAVAATTTLDICAQHGFRITSMHTLLRPTHTHTRTHKQGAHNNLFN